MKFGILGPLTVWREGEQLDLGTPKERVLLAVLLCRAGNPVSEDQLAVALWGSTPPKSATKNVQTYAHRLRRHLGDPARVVRQGSGYLMPVVRDELDAARFEHLAASGQAAEAAGDQAEAGHRLHEALSLWRGAVFAGMTDVAMLAAEAARLDEVRLSVLQSRIAVDLRLGRHAGLLGELTALTNEYPLLERLRAQLMLALYRCGRRADALAEYTRARMTLIEETGLDPTEELQDMHRSILTQDPSLDLVLPVRATITGPAGGSGPYSAAETRRAYHALAARMSDELGIEPSENVHLAHVHVLAADRPVLATAPPMPESRAAPTPAELPPDIADFTGRDGEVAHLTEVLTEPRPATVAMAGIAGLGGLGKTTLAVHVAHRIAGSFPDGQLYADLRGASADPTRPEDVLSRFLFALGISGTGIPESLEERVALYRSCVAGRRILVLLDNVAGEEQVRPLLPGAPGTAVILTGRVRLIGLEGASLLELDVLSSAQAMDLLRRIVGDERVQDDPDTALEIVRLCGRVPLAVRIAAARLLGRRHWSLSHLAGVLGEERHRLDELVAGDLDVRAGFEMSYRTLPAGAQRAFRLAGLLDAPDFASWPVAALLDVPVRQAEREIEILVDAHLLNPTGTDETGALRYRFHDLIRLYARERALREDSEPERQAALERALGAWLALAEVAAEHVPGPCYAPMHSCAPRRWLPAAVSDRLLADPMAWFGAEHAALMAGVAQACEARLTQFAWDLAGSTETYLNVRGLYDGWQRMHEQALALCRETGDKRGEAVLMRGLLEVTTWTSPAGPGPAMTRMRAGASQLLDLFTTLDDPVGMADALATLAWGTTADGNGSQALALAERALRMAADADYLGGQARALHVMAIIHGEDDPQGAVTVLERAMQVAEALGNAHYTTTITQFLGAAKSFCGDITGGRELLERSLGMARRLNDRYLETFSLLYLSKLFVAVGDERARATVELTLAHSENGNFGHHLADALSVLGQLNLAEGDLPAAIAALERSVQVWRTRGWIPYLARTLRSLGDAHEGAGDHRAARDVWEEARELFRGIADENGTRTLDARFARAGRPGSSATRRRGRPPSDGRRS
ncbi:AfsR/SARP family transcriptional regulator [Actinomadura rugatobispora]|uniref:BTAD domain-containing putative transcriptional regulator n=1 Tax=Actinomadura rugatobispora TaxID=1994 RepID=A0ABW1A1H7_9ACTN|nr:BTAD domain-containing putative transcriptional regulator [Actinomadura rugatobispora]